MKMEVEEQLVETAKKVGRGAKTAKAKTADTSWIAKGHAEAAAHNAKRMPFVGGRPFIFGDATTVGESSAAVKKELQTLPAKLAIAGSLLVIWGTLGAMLVGLMMR
ncbi:MAG: hypothetical protein AAF577_04650 [Pseudomonadota bacterium]